MLWHDLLPYCGLLIVDGRGLVNVSTEWKCYRWCVLSAVYMFCRQFYLKKKCFVFLTFLQCKQLFHLVFTCLFMISFHFFIITFEFHFITSSALTVITTTYNLCQNIEWSVLNREMLRDCMQLILCMTIFVNF